MAEVIGPLNILDKALPSGVDGTRLAEWALRDGTTYAELVNTVALALGAVNQQFITDWGGLMSLTEELFMEYEQGGSVTPMAEITDTDKPQPSHGTTIGHMLPLRAYGEAIGGTRRFFRDIRRAKLEASIATIVRKGIWRFEQTLLTREFVNTENVIGSAGYDVPFVRGSGGNIDFAPVPWNGQTFDTTHDHFLGIASGSVTLPAQIEQMAEHLEEHGHQPPYRMLVSRADVSAYYALTNFVQIVDANVFLIDRGGVSSGSQFFQRGMREMGHFGDYQSEWGLINLYHNARIPTGYSSLYKSYGSMDNRNPLVIRVHPAQGFGFFLVPETVNDPETPVKQLDVEFEFGVGVGMDRTNSVIAYRSGGGSWSNPTIS